METLDVIIERILRSYHSRFGSFSRELSDLISSALNYITTQKNHEKEVTVSRNKSRSNNRKMNVSRSSESKGEFDSEPSHLEIPKDFEILQPYDITQRTSAIPLLS